MRFVEYGIREDGKGFITRIAMEKLDTSFLSGIFMCFTTERTFNNSVETFIDYVTDYCFIIRE